MPANSAESVSVKKQLLKATLEFTLERGLTYALSVERVSLILETLEAT